MLLGVLAAVVAAGAVGVPSHIARGAGTFSVGAATASITPYCGPDGSPAANNCTPPPNGFVDPATAQCNAVQLATLSQFTGKRLFAFEEPYADSNNNGHYDFGEPFLDCNNDGRWDGNFIGGGSNAPRFYDFVADTVSARAFVVSNGTKTLAVEVLDNEGAFNVYLAAIRNLVNQQLPHGATLDASNVFISSTHDESAPDSIGLYGVTPATSSTNPYEVGFMEQQAAGAVVAAYTNMQPANITYGEAIEPANLRQCWSSYPFIDDQLMPALRAVSMTGQTILTLADVSQHAETLGFNGGPATDPSAPTALKPTLEQEKDWLSADWPYWFRQHLESTFGGVAIEMAGSVGSNETPQIFPAAVSRTPQQFVDASHPAGCRTTFLADASTATSLGYFSETKQLGEQLAQAVEGVVNPGAASTTNDVSASRAPVCFQVTNALFDVAGIAGVFSDRPGYADPNCTQAIPVPPTGNTIATYLRSDVAAFRIGDGTFVSIPGEVFPFTYLRGFVGPEDMPCPDPNTAGNCGRPASPTVTCAQGNPYSLPPWLMPHMHTAYRFIDGLGEDMIGYIFPCGNGVGVPGEYPLSNPNADSTDRFGCGHSDDSESASSDASNGIGAAAAAVLDTLGGTPQPPEDIEAGRYVLPGGVLSRNPLGTPDTIGCTTNTVFSASGPASAVKLESGSLITPFEWMSLSGRPQTIPDRNTRGWVDADGTRHWLDVFSSGTEPVATPEAPMAALLLLMGVPGTAAIALARRRHLRS